MTTTTESPERTTSPSNPASKPEDHVESEASKPAAASDTAPPPAANESVRAEGLPSLERSADNNVAQISESASTPDLPTRPQETPISPVERISPEVESLKAMFPDFDATIM